MGQSMMRGRTATCWKMHKSWKLSTSRGNGTMCDAIWHWLQMSNPRVDETWLCGEIKSLEMEQWFESFYKEISECGDVGQWWLWWQSLIDCSSRILRKWTASSSEDSIAQKATKSREVVTVTLFNALLIIGLPMGYESFVIQKSFNAATNFTQLRKGLQNFYVSTAGRHKGQGGSLALAVNRDFEQGPEGKLIRLCDAWTLCWGLPEETLSIIQQLLREWSPRQGMQETKRSKQSWFIGNWSSIGYARQGKLGNT